MDWVGALILVDEAAWTCVGIAVTKSARMSARIVTLEKNLGAIMVSP